MAKTLQELQALGESQSRIEKIIDFICGKSTDINLLPKPQSRIEEQLEYIALNLVIGGGQGVSNSFIKEYTTNTINYLDYNKLDKSKAINSEGIVTPDASPDWGVVEFDLNPNTQYTVIKPYNAIKLRLENESGENITWINSGLIYNDGWYKRSFTTEPNVVRGILEIKCNEPRADKIMVVEGDQTNTPTPAFVPFTDYGKHVKLDSASITFDNDKTDLKSRTIESAIKELDKSVNVLIEDSDNIGNWNVLDGVEANEFLNILSTEDAELRVGYKTNPNRTDSNWYVADPTKNIYTIQLGAWNEITPTYILWTREKIDDVCRQRGMIPATENPTGRNKAYVSLNTAGNVNGFDFTDFKWQLQHDKLNEYGYYEYHLNRFERRAVQDNYPGVDEQHRPMVYAEWATFEYDKAKQDNADFMVFTSEDPLPIEYIKTYKQYPSFNTEYIKYRKSLIGEVIYLWNDKNTEDTLKDGNSIYHKCNGATIQKVDYPEFFKCIEEKNDSIELPTITLQNNIIAYICVKELI